MSSEAHVVAVALARDVARAVAAARAELASMPFFVRPMVKRGFRKRTGRGMEEWERLCQSFANELESTGKAAAPRRDLIADLDRLKENFRTAPERAERGMGGDAKAMAAVRERSAERVSLIDELIEAVAGVED